MAQRDKADSLNELYFKSSDDLVRELGGSDQGLSDDEARQRLLKYGPNVIQAQHKASAWLLLLRQFTNPIIVILLFATVISAALGDLTNTIIILLIVVASGLISFYQEYSAGNAVEKLLETVRTHVDVLRGGKGEPVHIDEVVPGDVLLLKAGSVVPADAVLLEAQELYVNESVLTGETFPVQKTAGELAQPGSPLSKRTGWVFMGTSVESGQGKALAATTGRSTQFGQIAGKLVLRPPETDFEHGVRKFGALLFEITMILVFGVFAVNVFYRRPVVDSFLFSVALAVGLTPQLLPAIISVNLAKGSLAMARQKVIVRRPESIENFGSMTVLCTDKTGTITEGTVQVQDYVNIDRQHDDQVQRYAVLNARYQTALPNPIDKAILDKAGEDTGEYTRIDEIPYDFTRKRLSVIVQNGGARLLITKGAVLSVLPLCSSALKDGSTEPMASARDQVEHLYEDFSAQGFRILAVASRQIEQKAEYGPGDETDLTLVGFVLLADPPKPDVAPVIDELHKLGVDLKIITGDNKLVAAHVADATGFKEPCILTGEDLNNSTDAALIHRAPKTDIFAEVDPNQKERIIRVLQQAGRVVGYMGDGINDVTALHVADVGISVNTAVDVAKESADIVLLEKDLSVLAEGIKAGRVAFANTIKYIFMATSANFGNMFSVAGASLILPFLPLLPKQVLLTNLMTDFPELTIATDNVDPQAVEKPTRWNIHFIKSFMIWFGLLSSIFDYATFAVLLLLLHAGQREFRTGWFVESVLSASLIVLVLRTRLPVTRSRPSRPLALTTILVWLAVLVLPYLPFAYLLGFTPLPTRFYMPLAIILVLYIGSAEMLKRWFYRKHEL